MEIVFLVFIWLHKDLDFHFFSHDFLLKGIWCSVKV